MTRKMKSKLKDKASNPNKVATANHLRGNLAASSREATVNLSKAVTASNKEVTDSNKAVTASSSREATVNHRHSKVAMVVLHRPSPDTRLNKVVVSRVGTVLRRHHQDID